MKKIFTIILSFILSIVCLTAYADVSEVEGLQENYDKLWLNNYNNSEQIKETAKQNYYDHRVDGWKTMLTAPDSVRRKYIYDGTIEEQEAVYWSDTEVNYDNGFAVCFFYTNKYLQQYSDADSMNYLFDLENCWAFPIANNEDSCKIFKPDGDVIWINYSEKPHYRGSSVARRDALNYLSNVENIEGSLLKEGITKVDDLRIFVVNGDCTVIYIKSDNNEYFIRIYTAQQWAPEFEMYKVYEVSEAVPLMVKAEEKYSNRYGQTKPTFDGEAVALQNEGLLKGNERGLDLLKPLTRIEAVTMLLRAIGQEPAATTLKETFADVPTTHWGCAAAAKAEELGIVNGVGDNLFAPDKKVTATEFSTMVLRAAQETDFDWTQALNTLIETGIITDEDTKDMSLFTRGDMAKIIYEARNKGLLK